MASLEQTPELSVLLPVYNAASFVAEAIGSILRQTYRNFELLVIDDGSNDGSASIIDALAAEDRRIRVVRQENAGVIATLNRGIKLARAPLIARMDADDISLPDRFDVQMPRFRSRADLAVVGGYVNLVDLTGRFMRVNDYPTGGRALEEFLEYGCPVAHPTVIMRKCVVDWLGGYRPAFAHAEDYDLWLRVHDAGYRIENVARPVINYRQHDAAVSVRHRQQQELSTLVARLSHRARRAGFADPSNGFSAIDDDTILRFPTELRRHIEFEQFALKYREVSLLDAEAIENALVEYRHLLKSGESAPHMAHFILRCSRGLWTAGRRAAALKCLSQALLVNPRLALQLIARIGRQVRGWTE